MQIIFGWLPFLEYMYVENKDYFYIGTLYTDFIGEVEESCSYPVPSERLSNSVQVAKGDTAMSLPTTQHAS